MRRLTISAFLAGIAGALVLSLLLFSGGGTTQAATGVNDPTTGSVGLVAIDMITAGNAPGTGNPNLLGPIDTALSVPLSTTATVDVIVDEIAIPDGNATGFGFDLLYNPAIVSINGHSSAFMVSGGFEPGVVADPDFSGDWRDDYVTTGPGSHKGEGILTEVGIKCGATIGSSTLTLSSGIVFVSINTNGDPTAPIVPDALGGATIYCGEPVPTLVDESISSSTTSPLTNPVSPSTFVVSDTATVTNATAAGPVLNDVTQTLTLPGDCTTSTPPLTVVTSVSVPASGSASATTNWTVTCTTSSFHTFSVTQSEVITDPGFIDSSSGNDTDTSASTTGITATSDPAIVGASTSSSAASACLPQSPPAPGCSTAPVVAIGSPQTVTVTKSLANLSGYNGESVQDTVVFVGATELPAGPSNENPCAPTGPTTCMWSGGPAASPANLTEFGSTCTVTPVGPSGALGPGSSSQTVGPLSAVPTTATFTFTATCTNNSFFDSHNPKQIVLLFQDQITDVDGPDHHVTDTSLANNTVVPIPLAFWNRNPNFNPIFTETIDSTDTTGQTGDPVTIPSTHNCFSNQLAFPGGLPCEMYVTADIGAGMPLGLPLLITPQHTGVSKGFTFANGLTVPNGSITGAFGFNLNINFGTGCLVTLGAPYPSVTLLDGALPDHSTVGDPGGNGPEGPDLAGGGATLYNPAVWPTNLNSDPGVISLMAAGAVIWQRMTAVDPVLGTPVNILTFNAGTSYYTTTITGDPLGPVTPPGTQCTPFHTATDYLGKVAATGQVLRTCDDPNGALNPPPYVFVAQFTRADTYQSVNRVDTTNQCQASDTAITSMTKNETLGTPVGGPSEVDGGITYSQTVNLVLQGTGNLTLSLVGPAVCNPHWTSPTNVLLNNQIAGIQTSLQTILNATGAVTATYSFNCPPGDYQFQIIANMTPGVGETNTANNQFENHVSVHVITDIDHDGVPNNSDQCPNVPEDHDGLHGAEIAAGVEDGCPDTDVSVTVVKEENYNVDVSVDTHKTVTITVSNGNVADGVLVHILAVSKIGDCEVRLVPHPGDIYSEFYTDEVAGPPSPDTLNSQIEFTLPMGANTSVVYSYDYIIHCFAKSSHPAAFELQVDALPLAPVVEENLGLDQFPCGTPGHGPSDNVHKNCPNVTAWEKADLAKTGCGQTSNASVAVNGDITVTSTCTVKNGGPFSPITPVTYSDAVTITGPGDCPQDGATVVTLGTGSLGSPAGSLLNQESAVVTAVAHFHCLNPSFHTFTSSDTLTLTGPIHVYDPCTGAQGPVPSDPPCANNNIGSSSSVTAVTLLIDPSITKTCTGPASAAVNTPFSVSCTGNINLLGTNGGTWTGSISYPSDCTGSGGFSQSVGAVSVGYGESFNQITCTSPSDHTITVTNCIAPVFPVHVSDSNQANNCASSTVTFPVIATAVLHITFTPPPGESETGQPPSSSTIGVAGTVTNSGDPVSIGWTVTPSAGSGAAPCAVAGGGSGTGTVVTGSVIVTLPAGHECTYTICVTASATGVHEVGTVTVCQDYSLQANVLVAKYCIAVGPAAVNLSDTNGRYMWVICEIGNVTNEAEPVTITSAATLVSGALPAGCTRVTDLILPGQTNFTLGAHEQKVIVYRVRYECHSPATAQVITQTVTFTVTHVNDGEPNAAADVETVLNDNTKVTTKQVIIQ